MHFNEHGIQRLFLMSFDKRDKTIRELLELVFGFGVEVGDASKSGGFTYK